MKYIIHKPDLDTVFTAFLLGWRQGDAVRQVSGQAPPEILADPGVYCLECGGSGQLELGNFDHHNTTLSLPPACLQALHWREPADPALWDWAEYVAAVDLGRGCLFQGRGWSLSALFSGLRLIVSDPLAQFRAGVELCRTVVGLSLSPWQPLPLLPEWEGFRQAKLKLYRDLDSYACQVEFFSTKSGLWGGYLEAPLPGVHGLLKRLGCEVSVAAGLSKVTIACHSNKLENLRDSLNRSEPGWGGPAHGKIIGGPYLGSRLSKDKLISIIREAT